MNFGMSLGRVIDLSSQSIPFTRDPRFIREFKAKHAVEVFAEHLPTKKKCVCSGIIISLLICYNVGRSFGVVKTNPSSHILIKNSCASNAYIAQILL